MPWWGRLAVRLIAGIAAALLASAAAAQVTLSPADTQAVGSRALVTGRPDLALQIADALLARDPTDPAALILKSQSSRMLGHNEAAVEAGKAAWQHADGREMRFDAALATAQAKSSNGQRLAAQFWLRRAAQSAPSDRHKALAVRDLRYVRSKTPVVLRFDLSVNPSSNINNGSRADSFEAGGFVFELADESRALSGQEFSATANVTWRKRLSTQTLATLGVETEFRRYRFSDEAKAAAPSIDGDDFAYTKLEGQLGLIHRPDGVISKVALNFAGGHSWYGGDPYTRYVKGQIAGTIPLGDADQVTLTLYGDQQKRIDREAFSTNKAGVSASWLHTFPNRDRVRFSVGRARVDSQTQDLRYDARELGIDYFIGRPVFGINLSLHADWEQRDYDGLRFGAAREDTIQSLGLFLFLAEQQFYGFAPTIELSLDRTDSTIGLFESENLGMSLGLKSAF